MHSCTHPWQRRSALALAAAAALFAAPTLAGDINGDGIDDVVIGLPFEDFGTADSGAINIVYGMGAFGLDGFAGPGADFFTQAIIGCETDEAGDQFGHAVCVANFNGDPFDDIAIGIPFEDNAAGVVNCGAVMVVYGGPGGPGTGGCPCQIFWQGVGGVPDFAEPNDRFGWSLAAADFDCNGADDLAIGIPFEGIGGTAEAGAVIVIYGTTLCGLNTAFPVPAQTLVQGVGGVPDFAEPRDHFGWSLATGNFQGGCNPAADLAIGTPEEDLGAMDQGAVVVMHGHCPGFGPPGLGPAFPPPQFWHQDVPGVCETGEVKDRFGAALVCGDFDANMTDDLAIGVPLEDLGAGVGIVTDCGLVNVIYSTCNSGLTVGFIAPQCWEQNSANVPEARGANDWFGHALAAADFDDNGADDLAIGVPQEDIGVNLQTGGVNVIYGVPAAGLVAPAAACPTLAQFWSQNSAGVPEANATDDHQGWALAIGDFDLDGHDDLCWGVPGEDVGAGPILDAGGMSVVYGTPFCVGLSSAAAVAPEFWSQNSPGVPDASEPGDAMGQSAAPNSK